MSEPVRNILNYGAKELLNFYSDALKDTIPRMPVVLGNFSYQKSGKSINYLFSGFLSRTAFNNGAGAIFEKTYRVRPDEFESYRENNQTIFDNFETKIKEIVKARLFGAIELDSPVFDTLVIDTVNITALTKAIAVSFNFPNEQPAFSTIIQGADGADYDAIIAANMPMVVDVQTLAFTRSAETDGFFNEAVDVA